MSLSQVDMRFLVGRCTGCKLLGCECAPLSRAHLQRRARGNAAWYCVRPGIPAQVMADTAEPPEAPASLVVLLTMPSFCKTAAGGGRAGHQDRRGGGSQCLNVHSCWFCGRACALLCGHTIVLLCRRAFVLLCRCAFVLLGICSCALNVGAAPCCPPAARPPHPPTHLRRQ